jgi:S-adenosylmethionine-dependent methyltransferase
MGGDGTQPGAAQSQAAQAPATQAQAAHARGTQARGAQARAARAPVVWDALREVLAARAAETGRDRLDVVDAGGGTGGFAVPLAALGHHVTVVDPNPDSLAAAQRRAAEADVPIAAIQGEADGLDSVVGEDAADLVICHSVLEYVESPADALAAVARVLRRDGTVSVLAASAVAAVLHRALAGRFGEARALLRGTAGEGTPRRFTLPELSALIEGAGLRPGAAHGVRIFADLVPSVLVDADPGAADALRSLEAAAATHPAFRDIAAQLHVLGRR